MAHINLLPWRIAARKERQKNYLLILLLLALCVVFLCFMINSVYSARLEGQLKRNQYLTDEIGILDQQIVEISHLTETKASLQQRMILIEQLQRSRNLGTQIITEIAKIVPNGVYLTELEKKGSMLLLVGKSESNNRLSNMLRDAEQSELFTSPYLEFIESGRDRPDLLSDFRMHLRISGYEALEQAAATNSSPQGARN